MPTYDYACPQGHVTEAFRRLDERNDAPICDCGSATTKIISPTKGFVSFPAGGGQEYVSPASGKYITSLRERRDDMKRNGCRDWEGMDSEMKEAKKRVADDEKKSDVKLHDNVSRAYHSLTPKQKKVLD